ncbi:hypothetical protein diail_5548 [Diaporthe ilicicola]|nr:hypothetical protein diail_5548 [Diaporthe ilicicola]
MGPQLDAPFKVLILGGCYGGLSAALNLLDLSEGPAERTGSGPDGKIPIELTIVDEKDGFYDAYAAKAWVNYEDIPALKTPKLTVVQGKVTSVDPSSKRAMVLEAATQSPRELAYDYLVVATGLRRAWPVVPLSLLEAGTHISAVRDAPAGVAWSTCGTTTKTIGVDGCLKKTIKMPLNIWTGTAMSASHLKRFEDLISHPAAKKPTDRP